MMAPSPTEKMIIGRYTANARDRIDDSDDGERWDILLVWSLLRRYATAGWHGDFGVVAEVVEKVTGAAFGRLHTANNHGYGYVADDIPR